VRVDGGADAVPNGVGSSTSPPEVPDPAARQKVVLAVLGDTFAVVICGFASGDDVGLNVFDTDLVPSSSGYAALVMPMLDLASDLAVVQGEVSW
jgi:uncharacterized ion transporter superfamily protein YfcC